MNCTLCNKDVGNFAIIIGKKCACYKCWTEVILEQIKLFKETRK